MSEWNNRVRIILKQPGFAGVLASAFVLGIGYSFVSPFLSLWGTKEIGLSARSFGFYMTAMSLSAVVVGTALARWSDTRLSRKVVLLLGAAGGVLGYATYAFVHDAAVLVTVACTLLALAALCFSQLFAFTREHYYDAPIPGLAPGFLLSVVRVCFSFAWTAGPTVGAWMMIQFGFRGLFLGAAALYLLFLLGVWKWVPYERHASSAAATRRHEPVWRILTRGDVFAIFAAFLLIYGAHTLNMMNLPLMITDDLRGTGRDVGIAFGVGPLVEIPLMLWFGLLAGRGHSLALLRWGGVLTVLYFALLHLAQEPWHVWVAQVLHGTSFAIISNVGILFIQDRIPDQPGLATTVFANAANIGNLAGFLAFSAWADPLGHRNVFLVSAVMTVGMAAIFLLYRPRPAD